MEIACINDDIGEPKPKKMLLDDGFSENEVQASESSSNVHNESDDENLPCDDDEFIKHFDYKFYDEPLTEKLEEEEEIQNILWPNVGGFGYVKPILKNPLAKEPSVEKCDIKNFHLKKNLLDSFQTCYLKDKEMGKRDIGLLNLITDYYDVAYMIKTPTYGKDLKLLYTLHVLNHVLKSRAKIIHHNSKLSKNPDEEYRDQGFTRPTSLILVPFRHDCFQIVNIISSLLPGSVVMNKKRFEKEYGPGNKPQLPRIKKKPADYEQTFEGNTDEDFKIGLRIKNKSVTLYSKFYASDIIIASPLGLVQIIGAEGEKNRDIDFLSSIEILIIDRADVLATQNLVHFVNLIKYLNHMPKESHDCNFFRVRMYALDGMAKYYRQTLLFSSTEHHIFPLLVFQDKTFNYKGYLLSYTFVPSPILDNVLIKITVFFRWFDTSDRPVDDIDDRFNFFVNEVLPEYKDSEMAQTMVYVPSYFDFLKLRNYFREKELSSVMICEYSKKGKVAQARDVFFKGHRHFMLYTERAHFYNRYYIKGIQHIIFYRLPMYPHFFRELCNSLVDCIPRRDFEQKTVCVLSSKHDRIEMKHIVGQEETERMLNSKQKIFVKFVEGCLFKK